MAPTATLLGEIIRLDTFGPPFYDVLLMMMTNNYFVYTGWDSRVATAAVTSFREDDPAISLVPLLVEDRKRLY